MKPNLIPIGTLVILCVSTHLRTEAAAALSIRELPNGQVQIAWPSNAGSFSLEQADSLTSPVQWRGVNDTVVNAGGQFSVSIQPNAETRFYRLRATAAAVTRIIETSPAFGESGVAVTRETIFRFSGPLAADTMLGLANISAEFGGRRILSRVELSSDRKTATLFYLENLPASARIRVRFDGAGVMDAAGAYLDVDGDGQPGGVATFSFDTLGTVAVPATAVIGRVFASELMPGAGGGSTNRPLAGVTITVDGAEETLRAITDTNGFFRLSPCPAGRFFAHIDGRTSPLSQWPDGAYYPVVGKAWDAVAGRTNNLAGGSGEVFLPLIGQNTLQAVSATQDTTVTFSADVLAGNPNLSGVEITVPANALFSDSGSRGGKVGIAPVPPDRLPEPLPAGLNLPLVITIQTDGPSNFDRPVPVRFPNLPNPTTGEVLPPGAKSALWSFNHDTGRWEIQGPMTVTADGLYVVSDPGVGVRQPGWHGTQDGSQGYNKDSPYDDDCEGDDCDDDDRDDDDEDDEDDNNDADPCKKKRHLAALAGMECSAAIASTVPKVIPLVGCAAGLGLSAAGAAAECKLDPDGCRRSIIVNGISGVLGCIPGIGAVAGGLSAAFTCLYSGGTSLDDYLDCRRSLRFQRALALQAPPVNLPVADPKNIPQNIFYEQIQLWADAASLYALVFGSDKWTGIDPAEWPRAKLILMTVEQSIQPGSVGAERILQNERDSIMLLARPSKISTADVSALIDRFDRIMAGTLTAQEFDANAIGAAAAKLEATARELEARGWETTYDGFVRALEELTKDEDTILGGGAVFPGGSLQALATQIHSARPLPPKRAGRVRAPLYYRVTDVFGGFVQRGQLSNQGTLDSLIVAADTLYAIEYFDPASTQKGLSCFVSGPSGSRFKLPRFILIAADGVDTDADGLPDEGEGIIGTNPSLRDTDADGINDGAEINSGTNPLDGLLAATGIIALVDTPGIPSDFSAFDDIVVVAELDAGVSIFNVSNPTSPILVATLASLGRAFAVAGAANQVAVAADLRGLVVIDVADPSAARVVQQVQLVGSARSVAVAAGIAYVGTLAGRVYAIDMTSGIILEEILLPAPVEDLFWTGQRLYVLTQTALVVCGDVADRLRQLGSVAVPATSPLQDELSRRFFVGGGLAYVAFSSGFLIFDVSDPNAMRLVGSPPTPQMPADVLAPNGSGLLVTSASFIGANTSIVALYDASDPTDVTRFLASTQTPGSCNGLVLYNGLAFVGSAAAGLIVVNYLSYDAQGLPPAITLAAEPPEVEQGKPLALTASVDDDVQVGRVEFYSNGARVRTDGNFPFEHQLIAPLLSQTNSLRLRARAIDTGGNATWSDELVVTVKKYLKVIGTSPKSNALLAAGGVSTVAATFSDPVNTSTLNPSTFRLVEAGGDGMHGTADDSIVPGGTISWQEATATGVLSFSTPLGAGLYRASLATNITDRSGNALAAEHSWIFETRLPMQWNVDSNGFWDEVVKWSFNRVPASNDLVVIDRPADTYTVTVRRGNQAVDAFSSQEGIALTGGTLSILRSAEIHNTFSMRGGTLTGGGELNVLGLFTATGGRFDGGGTTWFKGGMEITNNGITINQHTLNNAGAAVLLHDLRLGNREAAFNNLAGAVFDIQIPIDRNIGYSGDEPFPIFRNAGTVRKSTAASLISIVDVDLRNDGLLSVEMGTLRLAGKSIHTGTLVVGPGATIELVGEPDAFTGKSLITGAGTVHFLSDAPIYGTYDVSGQTVIEGRIVDFNGPVLNVGNMLTVTNGLARFSSDPLVIRGAVLVSGTVGRGGGRVDFNHRLGAVNPASLHLAESGTIGGSGVIAPTGPVVWTGGTMTGSGVTRVQGGFEISGDSLKAIREARTVENAGTCVWTGLGDIASLPGTSFVNLSGARFEVRNNSFLGGGIFRNLGTFVKSLGTGTTSLRQFRNEGRVEVLSGRLAVGQDGSEHLGTLMISPNATLQLDSGPNRFLAGSSTAVDGTLVVNGITEVDGAFQVARMDVPGTGRITFNSEATSRTNFLRGTLNTARNARFLSTGLLTWTNPATISGPGVVRCEGVVLIVGGVGHTLRQATFENAGKAVWSATGGLRLDDNATFHNMRGAILELESNAGIVQQGVRQGAFWNEGEFRKTAGGGTSLFDVAFTNAGVCEVRSGTLRFQVGYYQSAGVTRLAGGAFALDPVNSRAMQLDGGVLEGAGTVSGDLLNAARVSPGASAGALTINGSFTQTAAGVLAIEIGGTTPQTGYDQLSVSGTATLAGTLSVALINGFEPNVGDTFVVLTYGSVLNRFDTLNGLDIGNGKRFEVNYTGANLNLEVVSTAQAGLKPRP